MLLFWNKMNSQDIYSLHAEFVRRIKQQFGEQADTFLNSLEQKTLTSVRINPEKFPVAERNFETVPWCANGIFLNERPVFTLDPLFHAGSYYVQEASSMFLEQAFRVIDLPASSLILDLCGAPGGKSTHLLSLMSDDDLLVTNEVIHSRAKILHENIRKWGPHNVIITNNDPKDFHRLNGFFDLIVVDAPCSGEGLFRKDISARNEWSPGHAQLCPVRQRRILSDIWPALKTGGYLIYSTCTFNPEENEENLKWLQTQKGFECIRISLNNDWNIDEIETNGVTGYRFLPHRVKSEGLFISVLRKTDTGLSYRLPKKQKNKQVKIPSVFSFIRTWIKPGNYDFQMHRDTIVSFPSHWKNELTALFDSLKVLDFGLPIAGVKGKNTVPTHFLALSPLLETKNFESFELDLNEALKFLRKEEIKPASGKQGWYTVRFRKAPLGFIKHLGSRTNNYYPKEWRIRMQTNQPGKLWYEI